MPHGLALAYGGVPFPSVSRLAPTRSTEIGLGLGHLTKLTKEARRNLEAQVIVTARDA
jgi:hypothetical protein